ncbi:MAG: zinc-ribbon domain-containing protein [Spirochaetota bacterium]|nr:zinc-ribbon domain-containing protein [Spirochaetota bacterium]
MSYCPTCGNKIESNSIYCSKCGSKANEIMHNDQGNNFAIIGLILGIISLFFSWTIVIPIVGLHFCKKGEKSEYKNYSYVGKILNLIALIIWLIAI